MEFLIRLVVLVAVYASMLYLLDRVLDKFEIRPGGILQVTVLLILVDYIIGWFIRLVAYIATLYIFYFFVFWIVNSIIMAITSKLSSQLEIRSTGTLVLSGFALAVVHMLYPVVRDIILK